MTRAWRGTRVGTVEDHDAAEWKRLAGVGLAKRDVLRVVVAGLEICMKKHQTGCGASYGCNPLEGGVKRAPGGRSGRAKRARDPQAVEEKFLDFRSIVYPEHSRLT